MDLKFRGSVAWVFPDHFDVDLMIGIQNVRESDVRKLADIFMTAYEMDFVSKINTGDMLVGGRNFGYGHAHPQVMATLRYLGIHIIIAESFAPGFFRGETNNGMVLMRVPGIRSITNRFDDLRVDYIQAEVVNFSQNWKTTGIKPSDMSIRLLQSGGYKGFLNEELAKLQ